MIVLSVCSSFFSVLIKNKFTFIFLKKVVALPVTLLLSLCSRVLPGFVYVDSRSDYIAAHQS